MIRRITRAMLPFGVVLALLVHVLLVQTGPAVGAEAERKPLETLNYNGFTLLLGANKGKVVAVNFFASWCPPCREEIPGLKRIRESFGADKLLLIGASLDEDDAALANYMDEVGFNYPVMKSGLDLARAAGVSGIPHLLIFDAEGEVAANQGGYVPEEDLRAFLQQLMEKE